MNPTPMIPFAVLLVAPTALLAHPGHAPGEPEHWVITMLCAALGVAAVALWQRGRVARSSGRRPGERE